MRIMSAVLSCVCVYVLSCSGFTFSDTIRLCYVVFHIKKLLPSCVPARNSSVASLGKNQMTFEGSLPACPAAHSSCIISSATANGLPQTHQTCTPLWHTPLHGLGPPSTFPHPAEARHPSISASRLSSRCLPSSSCRSVEMEAPSHCMLSSMFPPLWWAQLRRITPTVLPGLALTSLSFLTLRGSELEWTQLANCSPCTSAPGTRLFTLRHSAQAMPILQDQEAAWKPQ